MRATQIQYRLFYMLRSKYRKVTKHSYDLSKKSSSISLTLEKSIYSYESFSDGDFSFLNLEHSFKDEIDWNFLEHGKLWAYNLNYFEYLNQKDFEVDDGKKIIYDFIDNIFANRQGLEPFPNSLRGINWIKFLSFSGLVDKKIDDSLYAQYYVLLDTLEYHILGNHLLENGFSLLFGAYYFQDEVLFKKAKKILIGELTEEILDDGSHYELSPMYHQLMLFRILDCINLVKNNNHLKDEKLNNMLKEKAEIMLSWIGQFSYKDGTVAHFNDSSDGIAPTTKELFEYAKRLGLDVSKKIPLKECGYRIYDNDNYELRVDVGEIGPSYIPGHAHSDTFNFELRVGGKPFIVDTGISTYNSNQRRLIERQTASHNTVMIDNIEQSGVWSSFRVADRAHIKSLEEGEDFVYASHDGYKKLGIIHKRKFTVSDKNIKIEDFLENNTKHEAVSYIHFHPSIEDIKIEEDKIVTKDVIFYIKGSKKIQLDDFTFAKCFNKYDKAKLLKVTFDGDMSVDIAII